ncbi:glutathione peroxidase [Striga asiatica]|uniref:Probable phospholipid hydroperoxide glutathione peroxidase n=1 Tax=Striga asiatica TaxID=4170 RepID=A0A5A7QL05_STRAF|nr:glutathione peroxidase [Striga asiatica]
MSSLTLRILVNKNLIRPIITSFSSVLTKTHVDSPIVEPSHSRFELVKARFLSSSSCICRRNSLSWSLRADRTMASQSAPPQSVHDFTVKDAKGNDVDLSIYKGKVLLIVNVASQCCLVFSANMALPILAAFDELSPKPEKNNCILSICHSGLTNSNYTELTKLYEKYKDQGLEILAFPCNQFGSQEPGTNEQIQEFACTRFKAEYPIFDKIDVNGSNAAPLYKYLKSGKGGLFGDGIKWNFSKFLVDQEGRVVDRYAPTTSPLSIEKDIKKLLEKDVSIWMNVMGAFGYETKSVGLTNSNYTELTKLYEKYKDQGLEILAFPCNQFGSQEPGTNEQIQEFACTRFKAEYPIFDKIEVNGSNAAPLYKYLKSGKGGLFWDGIKWNFSKFLVDQEGRVVDRYAPTTSPLSIEKDIKKLLEKGANK